MDEFIGVVKLFAGNFAPRGWRLCNGDLMPIAQYTALFSLIGTTYGGNGQTNFALPNLNGRVAIGAGPGVQGTSTRVQGETVGSETVILTINNLPAHKHNVASTLNSATTVAATHNVPAVGSVLAKASDINTDAANIYAAGPGTIPIGSIVTTETLIGGANPLPIMQPSLALTYIICLEGVWPSRN